ncbi:MULTISPECIES: TraX family protein [Clostridium]|uniref:TraX family protein n=1 Tax=Clostridium aquiflavi TaxID=3073603 RepID=A0ABU1EHG4_9CLOT|nr:MULTISPECIES: TraX family protein [unclassified Clostridium]MDR5587795.1 TraX family protein [Clostridium sp. 5N-1]NFG62730.1 conjugal transfer protein TraX [Clostridium botulinum]NFQ10846.1 conjugal transfer protein TraX [Clostridium botulinum]
MEDIKKGIDGFTIKILALILMTFDHIGEFMPYSMNIPVWFHWLGRIVAPLFIFMVVEGFYHTHDRKKYIGRLYIWSVIMILGNTLIQKIMPHPSEIAIMNNIFATMFLITIFLQGIEFIKRYRVEKESKFMFYGLALIIGPLLIGIIILLTFDFLPMILMRIAMIFVPTPFLVEGGIAWIVLGIILYSCRGKKVALSILYTVFTAFIFVSGANGDYSLSNSFLINYQWIMIGALPLMLLYNGQKGKGMKYLFYVYYPVHVYLLYILGILLIK